MNELVNKRNKKHKKRKRCRKRRKKVENEREKERKKEKKSQNHENKICKHIISYTQTINFFISNECVFFII